MQTSGSPTNGNADNLKKQSTLLSIPSVKAIPVILAIFAIITACLTVFVNEVSTGNPNNQTTLIYGSGGTFTARIYQSLITNFFDYKAKNEGVTSLTYFYNATGSGQGRTDFFSGRNLFAVTDADISVSQKKFILPEIVNGPNSLAQINASQYINLATPNHLGVILLPGIGAGMGIVYNVPEVQALSNPPLVFNASVLGAIFCGNITLWNDTAIQELNPSVKLPGNAIAVIVRGDSSGSTQIFTTYLEKYSKPFQTKVGKGSQPKWPATFIKLNDAILLLTSAEKLPYSITYAPLDAFSESKCAHDSFRIGRIANKFGTPITPNTTSIQAAMNGYNKSAITLKHSYVDIFDSEDPSAYPISLFSFILFREFYYINGSYEPSNCTAISAMVEFWRHAWTFSDAATLQLKSGWVPLPSSLQTTNLMALERIYCRNISVIEILKQKQYALEYFHDSTEQRSVRSSLLFIDTISNNFKIAPFGSSIFVIYFAVLFLVSFGIYFRKIGEIIKRPKHNAKVNAKELKVKKTTRLSPQNIAAVLALLLSFFQFIFLAIQKSFIVSHDTIPIIFNYAGVSYNLYYAIAIAACTLIWLMCVYFITTLFPWVQEKYPVVVLKYSGVLQALMFSIPLYGTVFFNPTLEVLSKTFDCRFSVTSGTFNTSYDENNFACYTGAHWLLVCFSFLLVMPFVAVVMKYSLIFKTFKKRFDFKDDEWIIYTEPILKVITTLIYTLTSDIPFHAISFSLSFILGVALIVLRPNKVKWFEYCRAFTYFSYSFFCLLILVCENVVSLNDFVTLKPLNAIIQYVVIVYSALTIIAFAFVYYRHLPVQVDDNKKHQDQLKEFNAFFLSFETRSFVHENERAVEGGSKILGEFLDNDTSIVIHQNEKHSGIIEKGDRKITLISAEAEKSVSNRSGINIDGALGGNRSHASDIGRGLGFSNASGLAISRLENSSQVESESDRKSGQTSASDLNNFDWNAFENLINKGIAAKLLNSHQGKLILNSIALKDPIVVSVFRSSEKKFNVFLEMMNLPVWKLLELQASKSRNASKGKNLVSKSRSAHVLQVAEEEDEEYY